jgi:uncharacterized phage protein (TIGR01671 family)
MLSWEYLLSIGYGENKLNGTDADDCIFNDDGLELMQFTGLLDKNGKEIYEGDIVSSIFINGDEYEKSVVIFKDGTFGLCLQYGKHMYEPCLYEADDRFLEVIGNIYENKLLLSTNTTT